MSLDGKLLAKAREIYSEQKREFEAETEARRAAVYRKSPRVRELDTLLHDSMVQAIGAALRRGGDAVAAIDDISRENLLLQKERADEIARLGFPEGFIDRDYMCPKCRDTGYTGTKMCSCLRDIYEKLQQESLSSLIRLGDESFDKFSLDWYDSTINPETGISDRENMEYILDFCKTYAETFKNHKLNLYLCGNTGLGKTFLSACIARVVSQSGFSVVYETSSGIFAKFEEDKFSKTSDIDAVKSEIRRYMSCDLLILDDLGTELTTTFTISVLYDIINSRLISGRKTIISSNLSPNELSVKYSQQIVSRLIGEYNIFCFTGQDIRFQRKTRQ